MADRKATNKYYPPEWDPSKGSINTFRGSHPLRERARKLDQGIMIIRFELPYNIWCGGCGAHVGMGVRYNAEKTTVGKYYSTPIFKFRMKCHLCDNHFEIQTDPKNMDYVVVSGASRKNEKWEHVEGETMAIQGKSEAEKLATDPMYRLEHGAEDKRKAEEDAPRLAKLIEMQKQQLDDFELNSLMRKKFRTEKKQLKEKAEEEEAFKEKASISIPLVDEHKDDITTAKKITFGASSSEDRRRKRLEIKRQSVFGTSSTSPGIGAQESGGEKGVKRSRSLLMEACSSKRFAGPSSSSKTSRTSGTTLGTSGKTSGTSGKTSGTSGKMPGTLGKMPGTSGKISSLGRTKELRNSLGIKTKT